MPVLGNKNTQIPINDMKKEYIIVAINNGDVAYQLFSTK
jgi:hypothetical protein